MRKQFIGLQGIISEEFSRCLTQDEAFIFIGKTRTTAKILHRESNGLTLYVRKLSEGRFQIPKLNEDKRAKDALTKEVQEKLDKAAQKGIKKTNHIANLVRMLFTPKRERFVVSDEERGTLYEQMMESLEFTDEEKREFKKLKEKLDAYRQLKEMERLERREKETKGHGRNTIPENIPRLPEILVFPPEYYGHEDEYRIAFPGDTTEFLLPAQTAFFVQPYRRPVIVRKDDVYDHTIVADAVEGPIWKSYASAELLARIEVKKFGFHMPFWRQIKEMEMYGLPISKSTINGWHANVCDIVKPLYDLQEQGN